MRYQRRRRDHPQSSGIGGLMLLLASSAAAGAGFAWHLSKPKTAFEIAHERLETLLADMLGLAGQDEIHLMLLKVLLRLNIEMGWRRGKQEFPIPERMFDTICFGAETFVMKATEVKSGTPQSPELQSASEKAGKELNTRVLLLLESIKANISPDQYAVLKYIIDTFGTHSSHPVAYEFLFVIGNLISPPSSN